MLQESLSLCTVIQNVEGGAAVWKHPTQMSFLSCPPPPPPLRQLPTSPSNRLFFPPRYFIQDHSCLILLMYLSLSTLPLDFFPHVFIYCVCLWVGHMYHTTHVEARGRFAGLNSLPLMCGLWELNLDYQAWQECLSHHLTGPQQYFLILRIRCHRL